MKSIMMVLLVFLMSTSAFASFHRLSCTNAKRTVIYESSMAWNQPAKEGWTISGQEIPSGEVQMKILSQQEPLFKDFNGVQGLSIYTREIDITFGDRHRVEWQICESAGGI